MTPRTEKEIKHPNKDLERRITELTAQLEAGNKELEAFSYSISHDLQAPLRAIDGFSRALLEDYPDQLDAEGRRLLNIIRKNAQHMAQMIGGLVTFSRLGRQEMSLSDINMENLAKGVFEELMPKERKRAVQLILEKLPTARGDLVMIRQVFAHLLSNAIKFSRSKETTVIEISGRDAEGEKIYSVKDNGVGFDAKYAHKLFGMFQRLHTTDEFEGTGIGLALVQRIIHCHGGRVWAEGQVNQGATFFFTLPR